MASAFPFYFFGSVKTMDSLVVLHLINLCTAEIITSQAILSMRVVIWICCNVYYFENLIYTHTQSTSRPGQYWLFLKFAQETCPFCKSAGIFNIWACFPFYYSFDCTCSLAFCPFFEELGSKLLLQQPFNLAGKDGHISQL